MQAMMLLFALVAGMLQAPANTMEQETLKTYLEKGSPYDFILIDVRGTEEISAAIGSASCKPYNLAWPEQFKAMSEKLPKDMTVIVYCRSGGRAARAVDYLKEAGFTKVYNAGGMLTWTGPTVPPSELKPASLLPEPSCKGSSSLQR
jgi:rhodanese-related sulfurtransferase